MGSNDLTCLKITANAPETVWLEYDRFLLGPGLLSGANLLFVSGGVLQVNYYTFNPDPFVPKEEPPRSHVSNEKRAPGRLVYIGDEILPSYVGLIINHYIIIYYKY